MQSIEELLKNKPKKDGDAVAEKFQEKMIDIHKKEMEATTESNARAQGFSYINLKGFPLPQEALLIMAREEMVEAKACCIFQTNKQLKLAAVDPEAAAFQKISARIKRDYPFQNIDVFMISKNSFTIALSAFDHVPKIKEVSRGLTISEEDIKKFQNEIKTLKELNEKIKTVSVSDIFTLILAAGIKSEASDLHFDAGEREIEVRMRVDGVLHEIARIPKKLWSKVVSRIKFLAHLKINVDAIPQDGKFMIMIGGDKIDIRVSTLPASFGESVVFRLLFSSSHKLTLETVGMEKHTVEILEQEMNRSFGMLMAAGPTGSGKTTLLHAIMMKLKNPEINIMTIEDPIEYELDGITQTQVDTKHGMSFANGLRAILRQDPDIVLVGETRDTETAETVIQAALSGHLVLSTIHANCAAATIPRLLSMKVQPFLLAPAINCVMAQRLVRRVCQACKQEYWPDENMLKKINQEIAGIKHILPPETNPEKMVFWKGKGCEDCHGIGYKGRIGIFEIFRKNSDIEKIILSGSLSEYAIQEIAVKQGMITMIQDGLIKAIKGITSPEEVFEAAG
ncbi:MAG TPA: GspE/PulE family protein [Patescibacteria group bacterium]|nr:GspE/PulE family protein [Patescibacteria group bacterium]